MVAPRTVAGREYGVRHLFILIAILCALIALAIAVGLISVKGHNDALAWFFGSWLAYLITLFW